VTAREAQDYVALWRYVGYLLGTPAFGFFDTAKQARLTLESFILHEIAPSDTSRVLAHNMLQALARVPPIYASEDMLAATARWLNGHTLCDALDVPRPGWYYYLLMVGQCMFFMGSCYLGRLLPAWDRHKQQMLRRGFWTMIVTSESGLNGREAKFEMQWVPRIGKLTERVLRVEKAVQLQGIERRNLRIFTYGAVSFLALTWMGWVMLGWFLGLIGKR